MTTGPLQWLRTAGPDVVDEHGTIVRLRGVGVGGWLNMENFITGFPGNGVRAPARPARNAGAAALPAVLRLLPDPFLRPGGRGLHRLARAQLRPHPGQLPALGRRCAARRDRPARLRPPGPGGRGVRRRRAVQRDRPARRPGRAESPLAQRQPVPPAAVLAAPLVSRPGGRAVGGDRGPLRRPARGGRVQPAQRARGRVRHRPGGLLPPRDGGGQSGGRQAHDLPRRQPLRPGVPRLRRAFREHGVRGSPVPGAGCGRRRALSGPHHRALRQLPGGGVGIPHHDRVHAGPRPAGLGGRVRAGLRRGPGAGHAAATAAGRPDRHL